jgi:hypothetical protein
MLPPTSAGDPFYKFALDPVAEELDANRLAWSIRDGHPDKSEFDELALRWKELPPEFIVRLRRVAKHLFEGFNAFKPELAELLWPNSHVITFDI